MSTAMPTAMPTPKPGAIYISARLGCFSAALGFAIASIAIGIVELNTYSQFSQRVELFLADGGEVVDSSTLFTFGRVFIGAAVVVAIISAIGIVITLFRKVPNVLEPLAFFLAFLFIAVAESLLTKVVILDGPDISDNSFYIRPPPDVVAFVDFPAYWDISALRIFALFSWTSVIFAKVAFLCSLGSTTCCKPGRRNKNINYNPNMPPYPNNNFYNNDGNNMPMVNNYPNYNPNYNYNPNQQFSPQPPQQGYYPNNTVPNPDGQYPTNTYSPPNQKTEYTEYFPAPNTTKTE